MNSYIQIGFQHISSDLSNLLIAELIEIGYEGFEEKENGLVAFIPSNNFDEKILNEVIAKYAVSFSKYVIKETNWNAVWESNFEPISVDDFVGLRADFHNPIKGVEHEIVITPKMSFGTGHHATTFIMIQQMREIDFSKKTVFDFGTGTGILAILAERLGAVSILAVDNDDWSIANAAENFKRNNCIKVKLEKADSIINGEHYDIILANINKNIILDNLSSLIKSLNPSGTLLLSGLLVEDQADIVESAATFSLTRCKITSKNNWISLRFNR